MNGPRRVALNVSGAALLLAIAKSLAGGFAGSIALLSSALDSLGDALASFVNFVFLTIAARPPDEDHHWGHGKAEQLAALLQGALILAGAVTLAFRAIERMRHPKPIEAGWIPIVTMLGSIVVTVAITTYLRRNAIRSESTALAGDALHYTSDIAANLATIIALALVALTRNPLYDSILGIAVAVWIAWTSLQLIHGAGSELMDPALPAAEIAQIVEAIERADPAVLSFRDLRTRRSGGLRHIELELCIDRRVTFERAHEAAEAVKRAIAVRFPQSMIAVHAEPADQPSVPRNRE